MHDLKPSLDRRRVALGAGALLGTAALATVARRRGRDASARSLSCVAAFGQPASRQEAARFVGYFPNATFTTHEGAPVRFYDDLLRGKSVVVTLMYTGCNGVCPRTVSNLLQVKERYAERAGRDLFFYALSLDPRNDTPPVLAAYARKVGAGCGFTFLTGALADIDLVRHRLGLYDPDPVVDSDRDSHGAVAACGNEPLGRWCHVPALIRPERIVRTLSWILPRAVGAPAPLRA